MSKVLFLNIPSHGHINPTLGLVDELVKQGDEVFYFSSDEYKEKIESTGAIFKSYGEQSNFFVAKNKIPSNSIINDLLNRINEVLNTSEDIIEYVLKEIEGIKFDYIVYGSMFPFGNVISQILNIPSISSFAVFAKPKIFMAKNIKELIGNHTAVTTYKNLYNKLNEKYNVHMPPMLDLFFNKGDLNIAYTSKYFVSNIIDNYDDSFIFIGPPIYNRKENVSFPFEKLKNKKVVYISLGTVFNNTSDKLYETFFETFANYDGLVVMTAYNIDISKFNIPKNFIVKNYVPQSEILKYTDVAVTHGGMNSTSDLLYNKIPFVTIPIGADQRYIAARVSELGATISLDKNNLTPEILRDSIKKVLTDSSYLENINKISTSFKEAGGYKKLALEIIKFKKKFNIN